MRREPAKLLRLLLGLSLISAQLITVAHAGEHGSLGDTACVTCSVGHQLDHAAGAPTLVAIPARMCDAMVRASVPQGPAAVRIHSHPARAPPCPRV